MSDKYCPYCTLDTAGHHEYGCQSQFYTGSALPSITRQAYEALNVKYHGALDEIAALRRDLEQVRKYFAVTDDEIWKMITSRVTKP